MPGDVEVLTALWQSAVAAALPEGKFDGRLPKRPPGRTIVLGAGKASARMAAAFEQAWGPCEGLVVTRYGHGWPTSGVEVVEAAHPVPDAAGLKAAHRILGLARSATRDDLVVCLISGGASALLTLPAPGVSFAEKQAINRALLASGAPIVEMNVVRKSLSAIKGGRLAAAAAPARVVTYLISDVPGDDPATVGSGPTIAVKSDPEAVFSILRTYEIGVAASLVAAIRANVAPERSPEADEVHILSTPLMALEAAAARALALGIEPLILGDAIEGEARHAGTVLAGIARSTAGNGLPVAPPAVLLSGGETTVTVRGTGRGGRNSECLLAFLLGTAGLPGVSALMCDTDGIDGVEDNAGAWIDEGTASRAARLGLAPASYLAQNDAYRFFDAMGQLVVTGPTRTNVNDFRAVLIRHPGPPASPSIA